MRRVSVPRKGGGTVEHPVCDDADTRVPGQPRGGDAAHLDLAELLAAREPERLTVERRKAKRAGRLFIDTGRNGWAQTAVAPYSVRPKRGASVATPIDWRELGRAEPRSYTLASVPRRLARKPDV